MDSEHDPVAANRSANPRRTPDREPLGHRLMPALYISAAVAIVVATIVLLTLT